MDDGLCTVEGFVPSLKFHSHLKMHYLKILPLKLSLYLVLASSSYLNAQPSSDLSESIQQIVRAYQEKDSESLNSYVHPDIGIKTVFRRGVYEVIDQQTTFDFNNPVPEVNPYPQLKEAFDLEFAKLPVYSCDTGWSKVGLYCDTTFRDSILSYSAKLVVEGRGDHIPEQKIEAYKQLEAISWKIIWAESSGGEFIFYLSLIQGKWYISIVDRIASDCGV